MSRKDSSLETESRLSSFLGLWGRRKWGVTANGYQVSVGGEMKLLCN